MEELLAEKFPYFLPLLEQINDVHARYEKKKKSTNSMDFDDLLEKRWHVAEHEEIVAFFGGNLSHPCRRVPGTNKIQADFIDTLAAEHRTSGCGRRRAVHLLVARREFPNILEFQSAIRAHRSSR